jgi:alpha-tubulin suppressor-like RCC1 family protein
VVCDAGCCGGPSAGVARLAAGRETTCGVDGAGVLQCWGYNRSGAVGDGSTEWVRLAPVPVAGAHAARWVAVGGGHACAIDLAGKGWCWGSGGFGQLGDGTTFGIGANQLSPVAVQDLGAEAWMVAAGRHHSCALLAGGAVKCWGINEEGELGDGSLRTSAYPVTVSGVSAAGAVLSGDLFACAVTGLAEMMCWGSNDVGQLGSAAAAAKEAVPVEVTNLAGVTRLRAVALGGRHACVAYDGPGVSGGVRCWGAAPGNGRTGASATGVEVTGPLVPIDGVVALGAGAEHTCAVTGSGALLCWGRNADGQLGDGTLEDRPTAFPVSGLSAGVVGVSAGGRHTCALVDAAGGATALRCWGANYAGQLGDGTSTMRSTPTLVPGF